MLEHDTIIEPMGDRVLVRRHEAKDKIGSIHLPAQAKQLPMAGTVIAKGSAVHSLDEGETVLFSKYAGTEIEHNEEKLLLLAEGDVLARVHQVQDITSP